MGAVSDREAPAIAIAMLVRLNRDLLELVAKARNFDELTQELEVLEESGRVDEAFGWAGHALIATGKARTGEPLQAVCARVVGNARAESKGGLQ